MDKKLKYEQALNYLKNKALKQVGDKEYLQKRVNQSYEILLKMIENDTNS